MATPTARPATKYRRRLKALADKLLRMELDGDDLWLMQTDLLALQQEIQESITIEKETPRKERSTETLKELRGVRWHARHFGDTIGWLFLNLDRQFILSLADNDPVPIAKPTHGTIGMTAIATGLSSKGWGFPLLHDITDCLRIGDITFIRSTDDPLTVEIKTRLVTEEIEGGTRTGEYQVTVHSQTPLNPDTGGRTATVDLAAPAVDAPPRDRLGRQAERMRKALIKGSATEGIVEGLDERTINAHVTLDTQSHWKTVRRLIREAHRHGHAGAHVDKAFYYSVVYNANGLSKDSFNVPSMFDEVTSDEFLRSENEHERSILIRSVPNTKGREAYRSLPYFLFPIPKRAIFEILNSQLSIVVIVNLGSIVDALRADGHDVAVHPRRDGPGEIVVTSGLTDETGVSYTFEAHGVHHYLEQTIAEFHSIDFLLRMTRAQMDAARRHLVEERHSSTEAP